MLDFMSASRFSATGRLCFEFVVALYLRMRIELMLFSFMILATRFRLQWIPLRASALVTFRLP